MLQSSNDIKCVKSCPFLFQSPSVLHCTFVATRFSSTVQDTRLLVPSTPDDASAPPLLGRGSHPDPAARWEPPRTPGATSNADWPGPWSELGSWSFFGLMFFMFLFPFKGRFLLFYDCFSHFGLETALKISYHILNLWANWPKLGLCAESSANSSECTARNEQESCSEKSEMDRNGRPTKWIVGLTQSHATKCLMCLFTVGMVSVHWTIRVLTTALDPIDAKYTTFDHDAAQTHKRGKSTWVSDASRISCIWSLWLSKNLWNAICLGSNFNQVWTIFCPVGHRGYQSQKHNVANIQNCCRIFFQPKNLPSSVKPTRKKMKHKNFSNTLWRSNTTYFWVWNWELEFVAWQWCMGVGNLPHMQAYIQTIIAPNVPLQLSWPTQKHWSLVQLVLPTSCDLKKNPWNNAFCYKNKV